jgi:hypothetical protein
VALTAKDVVKTDWMSRGIADSQSVRSVAASRSSEGRRYAFSTADGRSERPASIHDKAARAKLAAKERLDPAIQRALRCAGASSWVGHSISSASCSKAKTAQAT